MIKKIIFVLGLGAIFGSVLLVFHQQPAVAAGVGCSGTAPAPISIPYCKGYFTPATAANYDSTIDVLPSGLFSKSGAALESDIFQYLAGFDPSGAHRCGIAYGGFRPTQCTAGAAFIIEAMLGHGQFNSSVATGVARAKADFGTWVNLVNSYANSTVAGYSVTWGSAPVCVPGGLNSGFSVNGYGYPAGGIDDDIFHNSDCPLDTTSEIQFHWPGGSFDIGENCGNIEFAIGKIPPVPVPVNHPPTGTISFSCNASSQEIAKITFSDADGPTTAYVTLSASGAPPKQTVTNGNNDLTAFVPNTSVRVYLFVKDVGPLGSQLYDNVASALTKEPCVSQVNNPPTGTITLSCNASSQQIANVTFSDADGPTTAYVTISASGAPPKQTVTNGTNDITSLVSPTTQEDVYLFVKDVGPLGSGQYDNVAFAKTRVPCTSTSYACGNLSVTSSSNYIDPSTPFNVKVDVNFSGGSPPAGMSMNLRISGPNFNYNNASIPANGNPLSASVNNLGPTNSNGTYTVIWNLNGPDSISPPCQGTFTVANLPYLKVYGGDAMIGASPNYDSSTGTSSCVSNNNAGIFSWNSNSPNFSGAGTEYAVEALAQIEGFASAQNSTSSPPTSPTGLSFANTSTDVSNNLFGGSFVGTTDDCYFTNNINAQLVNGPTTISPTLTVVFDGQQVTDYIKGDVYIASNIIYDTSNWSITPNINIPYYRLVVIGGNIYIDHNVTELDGLYVAEPENTSSGKVGGTIYTCAINGLPNPLYSPSTIGNNYYNDCSNKLNIYGSFIAGQVQFLRTGGTVGSSRGDNLTHNNAAEVFDYTPEMWLPRVNGVSSTNYSAITGLPPVL